MNLNTLIQEHTAARKAFSERAQGQLKEAFKQVFDKYPEITAFIWVQYTPYFNDGDTCEFSVNEITWTNLPKEELENIRWGEYEGELEVYSGCSWRSGEDSDAQYFAIEGNCSGPAPIALRDRGIGDIVELLSALNSDALEDVMQETFGDHVRVVATRGGFEIDDYDHD
jgi:hypothetical protein